MKSGGARSCVTRHADARPNLRMRPACGKEILRCVPPADGACGAGVRRWHPDGGDAAATPRRRDAVATLRDAAATPFGAGGMPGAGNVQG